MINVCINFLKLVIKTGIKHILNLKNRKFNVTADFSCCDEYLIIIAASLQVLKNCFSIFIPPLTHLSQEIKGGVKSQSAHSQVSVA